MHNLINLYFKSKKSVFILWILLLIFSIYNITFSKNDNFETELSGAEGTEAFRVMKILENDFKIKLGSSSAIVIDSKINTIDLQNSLKEKFKQIKSITNINSNREHKNQLLYIEYNPEYKIVETQTLSKNIRDYLDVWEKNNSVRTYLTGNTAFQYDAKTASKKDSFKGELIALLISLFILIFSFGALVSAFLPLLTGATTIIVLNGIIKFFNLPTNPVSMIITSLVGLALAIDYSLFIVSRYREELNLKSDNPLEITLKNSGKTILFSALIMICSVSVLFIPDVSLIRTVVTNLIIVIFISLINSTVFLPIFLYYGKNILDKPKFITNSIKKIDTYGSWKKLSEIIVDNKKIFFILSLITLILLSLPVLKIKLWSPVQTIAPKNSESFEGYKILENDKWGGELVPINIIVNTKNTSIYSPESISFIYDLTKKLEAHNKVNSVQSITSWSKNSEKDDYITLFNSVYRFGILIQGNRNFIPLINTNNGKNITLINVYPHDIMNIQDTYEIINYSRQLAKESNKFEVLVGGVIARVDDFTFELYRYAPYMLTIIFIGIYILLFLHMKSVILPIKAAIMNFLPIISSFGILTLIFQYGFMHNILNTPVNNAVTNVVPIILFCIVFGLSMDYEVLILSRITENYHKYNDTRKSVIEGLAKSGSIITGAALILLGVFIPGSFSSSSQTQEICIGIVSAIIIDATIVRIFLVPSFMMLMGKWNWWNPFKK